MSADAFLAVSVRDDAVEFGVMHWDHRRCRAALDVESKIACNMLFSPQFSRGDNVDRPTNSFLRGLDASSFDQFSEQLAFVELAHGAQVQNNEGKVDWVYFPETCLLSMTASDCSGNSVETSMVGNEGAAGLIEACSSGISTVDSTVQIDGRAWRSPAYLVEQIAASNPSFGAAAWRVAELQLVESRQSGLCQAMHSVEHRFVRWLLECSDRTGRRNPLPLTQDALSLMLGVQRTTVSGVASELQHKGLLRYHRGSLEILDAEGLEHFACDCRRLAKAERARLGLSVVG